MFAAQAHQECSRLRALLLDVPDQEVEFARKRRPTTRHGALAHGSSSLGSGDGVSDDPSKDGPTSGTMAPIGSSSTASVSPADGAGSSMANMRASDSGAK